MVRKEAAGRWMSRGATEADAPRGYAGRHRDLPAAPARLADGLGSEDRPLFGNRRLAPNAGSPAPASNRTRRLIVYGVYGCLVETRGAASNPYRARSCELLASVILLARRGFLLRILRSQHVFSLVLRLWLHRHALYLPPFSNQHRIPPQTTECQDRLPADGPGIPSTYSSVVLGRLFRCISTRNFKLPSKMPLSSPRTESGSLLGLGPMR